MISIIPNPQIVPYEVLKHTADLRLRVCAASLESLFSEAMRGMASIMKADLVIRKPLTIAKKVVVESQDSTALLVDFLNEILVLSHTNKEIYTQVSFNHFSETSLEAEIKGMSVNDFNEDIKAVTYHEANVRQNERGEWETILIFDI